MFQGYFLCKPELISGKKIPASKLLVLELLGQLQNPDVVIEELESLIGLDPVLSFKTLRLVNSACTAPLVKIESLSRAITYLGLEMIRSLTSLLAMSLHDDIVNALLNYEGISWHPACKASLRTHSAVETCSGLEGRRAN